jgi:spermidine synthase
MKSSDRSLSLCIILLGLSSATCQILLMRELLAVFYGNELSVGIALGIWLFMAGLGGAIFGPVSDKLRSKMTVFIAGCLALILATVLSIIVVRYSKAYLHSLPGEILGAPAMFLVGSLALSPLCMMIGALFAISCNLVREDGALKIGNAYILEAMGALAGGLLTYFVMLKFLPPLSIISILILLFVSALAYAVKTHNLPRIMKTLFFFVIFAIILSLSAVLVSGKMPMIEKITRKAGWPGFELLDTGDSEYGNITVTKREGITGFYSNGLLVFSSPDIQAQEIAAHLPMSQAISHAKVLVIGGGVNGLIEEIFKYPVKKVDYVELDPLLITFAKKHLNTRSVALLSDPRVNVIHGDGRYFTQSTETVYDLIIIDLPDPRTAQINRFYTEDFFSILRDRLSEDGIVSVSVSSGENYLGKEQVMLLKSVRDALGAAFPDVKITPGQTAYFLAAPKPGKIRIDGSSISDALESANVDTVYMNDYFIYSDISTDRIEYVKKTVASGKSAFKNTDLRPIAYYYNMLLWLSRTGGWITKMFESVGKFHIYICLSLLTAALVTVSAIGARRKGGRGPIYSALAITGFSEMGFQVILIVAFQVLYGYVYYKIALIVSAFMGGLALGGYFVTKKMDSIKDPFGLYVNIQKMVCIYPLLLLIVLLASKNFIGYGHNLTAILFICLPAIAGFVGGLQFPLAGRLCIARNSKIGNAAGVIYASDMIGSSLGALIISVLSIPILGIMETCIAISLMNLPVLISLVRSREV